MTSKAFLIFLLCLNVYAAVALDYEVVDEEAGDQECGRGNKQFKKNSIYFYHYTGVTESGILGSHGKAEQLQISAKLSIRFSGGCTYVMKIRSVELAEKQGNTTKSLDSKTKSWLENSLVEHDLLFTLDQGLVIDIRPKIQERDNVVLNIKRGILSMFQLKWSKVRDGHETDVSGICYVTYQKARKNGVRTIIKQKDLDTCRERAVAHSVIKTVKYGKPLSWFESSTSCEYRLRRKNEIEEVICKETFRLRPFSAGATSGGYTKSEQTMKLLRVKSNRKERVDRDFYISSLLYEHEHPHDELQKQGAELDKSQAENILKTLAADSGDVIQPEAANMFSNLVMSLRVLDETELGSLVGLAGKCFSERPCDPEQRLSYESFLFDALAQCGSTACVRVVSGIVSAKRIEPKLMKQLISAMALIQTPTTDMVNIIMDLHQKTKEPSILSLLGTIVNTFCSQQGDVCSREAAVRDAEDYILRLLGNDCTVQDPEKANEILHALKAIGNAGRPLKARELVIDCARNAAHQNVSIAALHTIEKFASDVDLKDFLYEMLADKNMDLERRMETFFILMGIANAEDALLIVDMVNDQRDAGQLRSLMHSYIHSILRTQDPFLLRLKEHFQQALTLRNLTDFDLPMSRFSHYKSWSYHLDGLKLGATGEAMMFFHPESFIPRTLRFNFTSNIFGHAMHDLGIDFRSEGLELLVANFLKKGGYLSSGYLQKLFSIPDAMPGKSQQSRRRARSSEDMPSYERRLEELENEVNLKEPWPQFSLGVKIFGREISVLTLEDLPLLTHGLDRFNIIEQLFALSQGARTSVQRNMLFLESQYIVPTITGLPLKLQTNGSAVAKMGIQGTVQISNVIFGPKVLSMKGSLSPSMSMELSARLMVDGYFSKVGVHVNSSLYSASILDGKLTYTQDSEFDVEVYVPEQPTNLLNVSQNVFHISGDTETPIRAVEKEAKVSLCSSDLYPVKKLIGMDLCSEVNFPVAFHQMDAPSFPLTGPSHFGLVLVSRDELLDTYSIRIRKEEEVYKVKISTPEAEIPREYKMDVGVSVSEVGGVIGATFGEQRKGLMLRYEYDNMTHSVKAQLESNLTKNHMLVKGRYFNTTDPITLQKTFGYQVGIKSKSMDVFNKLQFEDTYDFWAVDFVTKFSKKDKLKARFEIKYEPQVISMYLKRAKTNSMFYLELKPGFPAMSSYFNLTHGPTFAVNGTGMVDLQELAGEGELRSSNPGKHIKGRFQWVNKRHSKGLIARTEWGSQVTTLKAMFTLEGRNRVFTSAVNVNGHLFNSTFRFNSSDLSLAMDVLGHPVTLNGNVRNGGKENKIRLDLVSRIIQLSLEGGARRHPVSHFFCSNVTLNGTQYNHCLAAKLQRNLRVINVYLKHPAIKELVVDLKRKGKTNGFSYEADVHMYGLPFGKLVFDTQKDENVNKNILTVDLPTRSTFIENNMVVNPKSGRREFSLKVEKAKGYSNQDTGYVLKSSYVIDPTQGSTNSSFSVTGDIMPKVKADMWTAHGPDRRLDKLLMSFSMTSRPSTSQMTFPQDLQNQQGQSSFDYGMEGYPAHKAESRPASSDVSFTASAEYVRNSKLVLKASNMVDSQKNEAVVHAILVPKPVLTLKVLTGGEKGNATEVVVKPDEEKGYSVLALKHPNMKKMHRSMRNKVKMALNKAVGGFEAVIVKLDKSSVLDQALTPETVDAEILDLYQLKLDSGMRKKLSSFVMKVHKTLLDRGRQEKAVVRQKLREILKEMKTSLSGDDSAILLGRLASDIGKEGAGEKDEISQFVMDVMQILIRFIPMSEDISAGQELVAILLSSSLNRSLESFFHIYNISNQNKKLVQEYTSKITSLLTPLSGVKDPKVLADAVLKKLFAFLEGPDVVQVIQMRLSTLHPLIERYFPSSGKVVPDALNLLAKQGLHIASDSLNMLIGGTDPTYVAQLTMKKLNELYRQLLFQFKSLNFDSALHSNLVNILCDFAFDLDFTASVKDAVKAMLEDWNYQGNINALVREMFSARDISESMVVLARVVITQTAADREIKNTLSRFNADKDLKALSKGLFSFALGRWNISKEFKTQLVDILGSTNATALTKNIAKVLFNNALIPRRYRHFLEKVGEGNFREFVSSVTKTVVRLLQTQYPGSGLSSVYQSLFQMINMTADMQAYFDNLPFIKLLKGIDSDLNVFLKDGNRDSFMRSVIKRLVTVAKQGSTFGNPVMLGHVKKWLVGRMNETSFMLSQMLPEPLNFAAQPVLQEFVQVVQDTDFSKATTSVTDVVEDIIDGWIYVMASSKSFQSLLTQLDAMGADLGNFIEIDGLRLPEFYKRVKAELMKQIHLAARVLNQFSEGQYKGFQEKYVKNGEMDFYKMYQDFLSSNLTETILPKIDSLVAKLSERVLKEVQGRTDNYNKWSLVKNVMKSIMAMNYSGVNPVLEKYSQVDYARYSNLSKDALFGNVVHILQSIEGADIGGETIGNRIRGALKAFGTKLQYADAVLTNVTRMQAYQYKVSKRYLNVMRMNVTEMLRGAFDTLREDTKGNKKLRNVVETLGLPILSSVIKLIGNSPVGNITFAQAWSTGLGVMENRQGEVGRGEVNSLWNITRAFDQLQDYTSTFEATDGIVRLVDAILRYSLSRYERDTLESMESLERMERIVRFLKDFIAQKSHLPLVQMVPLFYKEAKAFAIDEYKQSPFLKHYVNSMKPLFENKLKTIRQQEVKLVNQSGEIYQVVSVSVSRVLESNTLQDSIPVIVKNASQIARKVLRGSVRLLDRIRMALNSVEVLKDPKRYFGMTLADNIQTLITYWEENDDSLYGKIGGIEERIRGQLKGLGKQKEVLKEVLSGDGDSLVANLTGLLNQKFSAMDSYLKQMRSQLTMQSEEYIYRLTLNWNVMVGKVSGELNKLVEPKEGEKVSILERTEKISKLLNTWRKNSRNATFVALAKYYTHLVNQIHDMAVARGKAAQMLESVRQSIARNMSQVLDKLPSSAQDAVRYIQGGYVSAVTRMSGVMNATDLDWLRSMVSRGWQVQNGVLSVTIPWTPRISTWLQESKQTQEHVQIEEPQRSKSDNRRGLQDMRLVQESYSSSDGIRYPNAAKEAESVVPQSIFESYNAKFDQMEQAYHAWLGKQSSLFAQIAHKYRYLVDRITINATDYMLHLYQQRFLRPFKSIADDASIATPVDSVPPMPTFPRIWSDMTAIFKPMTRTAVLYGSHIFTFDGQYVHTAVPSRLRSDCTYVLAHDFRRGNFTLLYQNGNIILESLEGKVVFNKNGNPQMAAYEKVSGEDGDEYLDGPYGNTPWQIGSMIITKYGHSYNVRSDYGFEVNCNINYMLCNFTLSGLYHNKTLGLFGTNNQEFADDLRLPGGRIAVDVMEFLNDWELTQSDQCYLHDQKDFMYSCRRLPSPRCREIFKDTRSPLANAFRNVNPSPFLMACEFETSKCDSYSASRVAHCPIATAYAHLAASFGVNIPYLKECASCKDERSFGYTVPLNRQRRREKAVDVVVLVRESGDMEAFMPVLERTLGKLDGTLKLSGMDVLYRLVGFEGPGHRMQPHAQTGNSKDAMNLNDLLMAISLLKFDGPPRVSQRQGLGALRFAAGLPLRPLATKIFLMIENDASYSGRLQEMMITNDILTSHEISLNVINNYRLKRGVIGKSASGKRYHVKIPKGEQLRNIRFPPSDDYVPIVRETGGAILTLKGLFSSDDKFLKAYPVSLSSIVYQQILSDMKKCKKCSCQQDRNGFGIMRCFSTKQGNC